MERDNRKHNNQIEIHDLIDEAVNNALARRNQAQDASEGLTNLSDEEVANIVGGKTQPAIAGFKPVCPPKPVYPPIIVGLVATDPNVSKA
ncbi:hypothetical protein A6770_31640 [Nostoc minutum NIES-26]|uniref:Uncharacterized protein n=1 Tax=Nostoc minutum NIES-26 TaxID=1844469 RepID=A0A367Q878_9NOSO|nr:hypothetical protein A6770_31640 [Nostoc minutum NIES-26]